MSESPTPSGGERAPPTGKHAATHVATHLRLDVDADVDADAERPVDGVAEFEEFDTTISDSVDIPIGAPIEDVIEQHIAVPFDDDVRSDAS